MMCINSFVSKSRTNSRIKSLLKCRFRSVFHEYKFMRFLVRNRSFIYYNSGSPRVFKVFKTMKSMKSL